jgi:hypothetical protein
MNQSSFRIRKSKLLNELKKITKTLGPLTKWTRYTTLELTITDGLLTLVIPGARLELKCVTTGTAKATLGLYYFRDIIKNWNNLHLECFIYDAEFKIGVTSIKAKTTFFENDSILRSINLPINYSELHILQLEYKGFTEEEIDFNKLEFELYYAKKHLKLNIKKAIDILGLYGVTTNEIEELIQRKIKPNRHDLTD